MQEQFGLKKDWIQGILGVQWVVWVGWDKMGNNGGAGAVAGWWWGADKDTKTPPLPSPPPNPLSDQCSLYCNICVSYSEPEKSSTKTTLDD